ncbi:MAG TPA: hypothetical protein VFE58_02225 [Tepidisphaeraceae bacterium]|jgi:uncharacterized integral membrane protein|nr:hypothetical protein [Tepidisphaeraceae bacterium]
MSNTWLKIKVWTKLTIFFLVLIYLLIFVSKNSSQHVEFWYWYNGIWPTSLLYFTFFTFLAGIVVTLLARTIYKTVGQFRELRHRSDQDRRDRELRELQAKTTALETRAADVPSKTPDAP